MQSVPTDVALEFGENAMRVLDSRYLQKDENGSPRETPVEMFRRVAANISMAELKYGCTEDERKAWEDAFFGVMTRMEFLPNSPTLMNAGTEIQQLSACFVLPVDDSMEAIFESIKQTALIHKSGGGTGFSFSRVRPKDDPVNSTKGVSSGPISFMQVFDAATETVKQGGRRRGANMAILRVDHPDIMDFIRAKEQTTRLNNFNLSVAVTDRFMEALAAGRHYDLVNPRTGEVSGTLDARVVFDTIVDCAWRTGEPGVVFIDRVNEHNPTPALGPIESTNPCGEQPLLPYESCNLGSINLARFARFARFAPGPGSCDGTIDYAGLERVVGVAVRFLDDVIDMNCYPLPEIDRLTKANRKIGLGVMGFAETLIRLGIPYESDEAVAVAEDVMACIHRAAKRVSHELAVERGAFSNFADSLYATRGEEPLRNATVTTIAPTGSISIIAETSSGVEPLFALAFVRRVLDGQELVETNPLFESIARAEGFYSEALMDRVAHAGGVRGVDEVPERWRRLFQTAHDISPEAHVRIQAAFQKYTDNAVSKTVNFAHDATREDVEKVFGTAYELDCKGVTIYRDGSREQQVLSAGRAPEASRATAHKMPKPRPDVMEGATLRMGTGCGNLYVTINENGIGPFELFAHIGKAGGCAASQTEAIGRLISLALRAGVEPRAIAKQIKGVRCPSPAWNKGNKVFSCADAIGQALAQYLETRSDTGAGELDLFEGEAPVNRLAGMCMECGSTLEFEGGCSVCRSCGYSRC